MVFQDICEERKMRIIETEEMKRRLVDMAEDLNELCDEHGLTLYMSGGTLLGAVRHKGFIPWDDDIDLYMTRPDYDRFVELMRERNEGNRFKLYAHEIYPEYIYPFAKYVDTQTLLVEKGGYAGKDLGLFIDVFPIDGLGNSIEEAKAQMRKCNRYITLNLALLVKPWRKDVSFVKNFAIACLRAVAKIWGSDRLLAKLFAQAKSAPYESSRYVGEYIDEIGEKRIMLKDEMYNGYVTLDFERLRLKAPLNYDKWLTQFYGDYMKLPPEEKRVATHGYELYDKESES